MNYIRVISLFLANFQHLTLKLVILTMANVIQIKNPERPYWW